MPALKKNMFSVMIAGTSLLLILGGCGGSGSNKSSTVSAGPVVPDPPQTSNQAPLIDTPATIKFLETDPVRIAISASDPEDKTLSYSLKQGGDNSLFSVNSSGLIRANAQSQILDFETPTDTDKNNTYDIGIMVSDGVNEISKDLSIVIDDVGDQLSCTSPGLIEIPENKFGELYTFHITDPELTSFNANYSFAEITINGGNEINYDIGGYLFTRDNNSFRGTYTVDIFEFFNAEAQTNLDDIFTYSFSATTRESSVLCSLDFRVKDVPSEVKSGVKFSGTSFDAYTMSSYNVGDISADGIPDYFLSSRIKIQEKPWEHQAHLVFGAFISSELQRDGAQELLLQDLKANQAVRIHGVSPQVSLNEFIGNYLVAQEIGDIDNDGINELLVGLSTQIDARAMAFADLPFAYLLWGDALTSQVDGEIDLNNLLPSEGLILDGLGGINRERNSVATGDFDGDGLADIFIGVPRGRIQASDTTVYTVPKFIVFGDYLLESKPRGRIDLLEDVSQLDRTQILLIATERSLENSPTNPPPEPYFSGSGLSPFALKDINGDGADELVMTSGSSKQNYSTVGVLDSKAIIEAKVGLGLLNAVDVSVENLTIFETPGYLINMGQTNGDVDGDGINDLIFGGGNYALVNGRRILSSETGQLIETDAVDPEIIIFNPSISGMSFIGDIDGDGLDDLAASYQLPNEDSWDASVAIILAKSLSFADNQQPFDLDKMPSGDVLHILSSGLSDFNPGITVFSPLKDIDGDSIPDLSISYARGVVGKEAYIVRGSDIKEALETNKFSLNLDEIYRSSELP